MSSGNIRRAQLVSPFGVGALSILVDGTSVITAGLDAWYSVEEKNQLRLSEYQAQDWRLQARLRVSEFRLPPDYRTGDQANAKLTVPVLRFPGWSFCMYCKRLEHRPLTFAQPVYCEDPKHKQDVAGKKKRGPRMSQVPFVAICTAGHLADFPFQEWVHRSHRPSCNGVLRLQSRGGGGLDGQVVVCDEKSAPKGCGLERSLAGILIGSTSKAGDERTNLTDQLAGKDDPFFCTGARPWLGADTGSCGRPVRGALRAAGNIYFPKVESSIYLPQKVGAVSAALHELLNHPDASPALRVLHQVFGANATASAIRNALPAELFKPIIDEELLAGYRDLFGITDRNEVPDTSPPASDAGDEADDADRLTSTDEWRHDEYRLLRETPDDPYLTAKDPGLAAELEAVLDRVRRVDVLRETRAMRGFTRVRDGGLKLTTGKRMLRREFVDPSHDWLPAYVVKGEGIYLELNRECLETWEERDDVLARAQRITERFGDVARLRGLRERVISPRFVLLHTLGHLLINELIFACGYSSASLRERMYVSESLERNMAGILIYTAAGDSEGTMGGLVRMAKPERLWPVIANAISDARWCSTDPVCMESGGGQGPDSCNLAACHGCALLPETSCEEFNRFLDRGLVVGTLSNPELGFFSNLASNALLQISAE